MDLKTAGRQMTEEDFIDSIDASFCQLTPLERREAVECASAISANAVLMVLYEIAVGDLPRAESLDLIDRVGRKWLATDVVSCALAIVRALLEGQVVDDEALQRLLDASRASPGAYNALGIIEACDERWSERCSQCLSSWGALRS